MTSKISTLEDLALHLTGQKELKTNGNWNIVEQSWACPCCKRTKLHIARPMQDKTLKGALVNHHDHLTNYANVKLKELVIEVGRKEISEREGWFNNHKIKPFIVRFERTLICEDCNNADPAAKAMIEGICPYFSFTPEEIAYFIRPKKHSPHQIDQDRVSEIYELAHDNYNFQKSLCETLLSRLVQNARHWGDQKQSPNITHYLTVKKIRVGENILAEDLLTLFNNDENIGPKLLSDTINLFETAAHAGVSEALSAKEEKRARKKRLKLERLKKKTEDGYFNHNEPWKKSDVTALKTDYKKVEDIIALSKKYGRTPGSIKAKLKTLGFEFS